MKRIAFAVVFATLAGGALAFEKTNIKFGGTEDDKPKKGWWGLQVGTYLPASEEIRDQFGDALLRTGVSPMNRKFGKKMDFNIDFNILNANEDGRRLLLIPVTGNLSMGFGQGETKSFVSIGAGPAYYDYKLQRLVNNNTELRTYKESKIGWNTHIEAGVLTNERLSVVVRYDWYEKSDDFLFDGFSASVNYAIVRW